MSNKYPGGLITSGANAGYSVFFDGNGDFLTVPNNSAFLFGTGDFTVEFWVNFSSISATYQCIAAVWQGSTNYAWNISINNANVSFAYGNGGSSGSSVTFACTPTTNTWAHFAVTRASNSVRCFLNGAQIGTTQTISNNLTSGTSLYIGANQDAGPTQYVNGYVSNLRIIKGTALYTATFTPPTQLLNVTNTSLLTCNSPAIVDQSSNNFTITANGNAAVSTFTPFQGYVAYNPALGAATPGIWTVSDAIQAAQTRRWNMYDPYFNYTTLLLHGNGTNGAQNNTFLDSSSNNFTITRNGNTTQGTFSPFSQTGWSNYFDGSASYRLTIPDSTDLDLTGDFCLEGWFYFTSFSTAAQMVCIGSENAAQNGFVVYISNSNGTCSFYSNGATVLNTSAVFTTNEWQHVAVVRSGAGSNNLVIYRNGVSVGAATNTTSFTGLAGNGLCIGQTYSTSYVGTLSAYVSNVRLVKGSPVYTGSFTPSTTPLTPITNTVLLTCQSNRFIDTNTQVAAKTITVSGTPSVQAFSPFLTNVAYTPTVQGGSGYFDGTTDYLATGLATALDNISGDFTIEYWQYPIAGQPALSPVLGSANGSFSGTASFVAYEESSNKLNLYLNATQATSLISYAATTKLINQWSHVAWVRSGSVITLYLNGTSVATVTYTNTISLNTTNSNTYIGRNGWDAYYWYGYISGLRIVKGTAIVPSGAPTTPPTAVTNTQLLLNYTNAGITDATAKNDLETVGGAQISTTQSKFGGSSMYFDGTGDRLYFADGKAYVNGTEPFTLECWVYLGGTPNYWTIFGSSSSNGLLFTVQNLTTVIVNPSGLGNTVSGTTSLTAGTWFHLALTRNSANRFDIWVNGASIGNATSTQSFGTPTMFVIGAADNSGGQQFNGYLDDVRISKFCRYTGTFTPQTSQWQDQ